MSVEQTAPSYPEQLGFDGAVPAGAAVNLARPLVQGTRGVVACGHPIAAGAAIEAFASGGNAVDAALAAAATLSVVSPDACGLGGDSLALVSAPDGRTFAFNGSGAAPTALTLPIPADGAGTVAVPGAVDAWCRMHELFGGAPLDRTLSVASNLARSGFPAGAHLVSALGAHRRRLLIGAPAWELVRRPPRPGDRVRLPALAELIDRIGREGPDAFYTGPIAEAIADAVAQGGGALTPDDLDEHATIENVPPAIEIPHAQLTIQPPVSQAVLAPMILRAVARHAPTSRVERTHLTIEAVEAAFAHRDRIAEASVSDLLATELVLDARQAGRRGGPRGYSHTTTVATADADGLVVSMLISVFDPFGAAVHVAAGGFLLNDRLIGFSPDEQSPNAPAPGRRPVHTLSPVVVDHASNRFALATPGADGQVQTLVQLVHRIVDDGTPVADAVGQPRWRSVDGRLAVEPGFDQRLLDALSELGHDIDERPAGESQFGAAVVAGVDQTRGLLFAAADPRRETWAGAL